MLSYMTFMLERAAAEDVPVRRQDFARDMEKPCRYFVASPTGSIALMHVPGSDT